eukprot:6467835-Amphidinium_carterae.1
MMSAAILIWNREQVHEHEAILNPAFYARQQRGRTSHVVCRMPAHCTNWLGPACSRRIALASCAFKFTWGVHTCFKAHICHCFTPSGSKCTRAR